MTASNAQTSGKALTPMWSDVRRCSPGSPRRPKEPDPGYRARATRADVRAFTTLEGVDAHLQVFAGEAHRQFRFLIDRHGFAALASADACYIGYGSAPWSVW